MTQKTKSMAVVKKEKLSNQLQKAIPQLQKVATKHLKPERMIALAMRSASRNPKILNCTPQSILGCVFESQTLGLEIDSLGQGYIVPFKDRAQFIIGYRGLINLAQRTGKIASIHADLVREEEWTSGNFDYLYGDSYFLKHKPMLKEWDDGFRDVVAIYAYAKLTDGGFYFVVVPKSKVEKARLRAPSGKMKDSPWHTHWDEMAKKTCIRRLAKYLPMSVEFERALKLDKMVAEGKEQDLDIDKIGEDGQIDIDGLPESTYEEEKGENIQTRDVSSQEPKKKADKKSEKEEPETKEEAVKLNKPEAPKGGLFNEEENWESPEYCAQQIENCSSREDLNKLIKEHGKDFERFGGADEERVKAVLFEKSHKLRGI